MLTLKFDDWCFRVDVEATREKTTQYSLDHCTCGYCKNFYETVALTHPEACDFLNQFGVNVHGPSELMPFEPTLMLACYRIQGEIIQWGRGQILAGGISVSPEISENGTFLLWFGELRVPWVQQEIEDDVVSPANLPEFLERMQAVWTLRHGNTFNLS